MIGQSDASDGEPGSAIPKPALSLARSSQKSSKRRST
jgi:hypothetical protein